MAFSEFPPSVSLTPKWARSNSSICFVGSNLQCADLKQVDQARNEDGPPSPVAVSPGPLGAMAITGPQCILCQTDRILIGNRAQGAFTIKLTFTIAKNGVVTKVESESAPTRNQVTDRAAVATLVVRALSKKRRTRQCKAKHECPHQCRKASMRALMARLGTSSTPPIIRPESSIAWGAFRYQNRECSLVCLFSRS
jgi:hypothetical protein